MKILCLHGKGTSAEIFESQTESIRQLLPDHFEYVFPEAETPCGPAPGIEQLFPGPYSCWCRDDSVKCLAKQHEIVNEIIDEEGPFDAVMAFSQGAALAASVLLHHEIEHPLQPPPFRCAVFICATQPFTKDATKGVDITEKLWESKRKDSWASDDSAYASLDETDDDLAATEEESRCRWFDPDVVKTRIRIPTAHIKGARDRYENESDHLIKLCDRKEVYEHPGGHEIPTRTDVSLKIVETVKKTLNTTNYFM